MTLISTRLIEKKDLNLNSIDTNSYRSNLRDYALWYDREAQLSVSRAENKAWYEVLSSKRVDINTIRLYFVI